MCIKQIAVKDIPGIKHCTTYCRHNKHKTWPLFQGTHCQVKGESDKMTMVQYSDCNIVENEEKIC